MTQHQRAEVWGIIDYLQELLKIPPCDNNLIKSLNEGVEECVRQLTDNAGKGKYDKDKLPKIEE